MKTIAADAMVLMSASTGGAAHRVFLLEDLSVVTTDFNIAEAIRKVPILIEKYRLDPDEVSDSMAALPLKIYAKDEYESHLGKAHEYIGQRDPKDVSLLALALKLEIALWSQDKDFDAAPVERLTTGRLLALRGQ